MDIVFGRKVRVYEAVNFDHWKNKSFLALQASHICEKSGGCQRMFSKTVKNTLNFCLSKSFISIRLYYLYVTKPDEDIIKVCTKNRAVKVGISQLFAVRQKQISQQFFGLVICVSSLDGCSISLAAQMNAIEYICFLPEGKRNKNPIIFTPFAARNGENYR